MTQAFKVLYNGYKLTEDLGFPDMLMMIFFPKIAFTCVSCQTENVRTVDFKASAAFVLIWSKGVLYKIWWMK